MLDDNRRAQLDGIVQKMHANGEPDEAIQTLVDDFKGKYAQPDKGSATSRLFGALADAIPEPIRHPSMLAEVPGAVMDLARENPMALINPTSMIGQDIAQGSVDSFNRQRYMGTNLGSSLAAAVPVIGPAAAQVGEDIGGGDYAAAAGHAIPLLAPFAAESAAGLAGRGLRAGGEVAGRVGARVASPIRAGVEAAGEHLVESPGLAGSAAKGWKAAVKEFKSSAKLLEKAKAEHAAARAALGDVGEIPKAEILPATVPETTEVAAPAKAAPPKPKAPRKKPAPRSSRPTTEPQGPVTPEINAPQNQGPKQETVLPNGLYKDINKMKSADEVKQHLAERVDIWKRGGQSQGQMIDSLHQTYGLSRPQARTFLTAYLTGQI